MHEWMNQTIIGDIGESADESDDTVLQKFAIRALAVRDRIHYKWTTVRHEITSPGMMDSNWKFDQESNL